MKIGFKQIGFVAAFIITLIALNVYQWQNPRIVEVPSDPVQFDSTAWVQRAAYNSQKEIIRKLENENQELAKRVKETGDAIANYAAINAKLNLQVDSLQKEQWHSIDRNSLISESESFLEKAQKSYLEYAYPDTSIMTQKLYGNGLFLVTGYVHFRGTQFRQELQLEQLRDINLSVVNTMNSDRNRMLTYIHSPDFESLEYKSITELKPKTKFSKFWIGVGVGVISMAGLSILLQ